ncbi:pneumococcal serine-rich repeat protein isoform X1 [Drosophila willistoni]|uniref:pneumococcal serine-rich repeat protein isoform X1 n=1 Tax=Drosophila willistoni TaxID=7260 RepID=UPI00017D89AC|nr:pneumococcal serine-rich repeat protein isoform X1 [Drosophila willistoni]
MPFVQRIVQPVNVAQATAASIGHASNRFHCVPGKCKNNNCINKQQLPEEENVGDALPSTSSPTHLARALVHHVCENGDDEPRPPAALPMKKLKQHVEFLSTSPTPNHGPSRHVSQSLPNSRHPSQQRSQMGKNASLSAPQSPTAGGHYNNSVSKVISGHEFDSISNITLSNALRQLASLVLIASDIFDELQRDLQSVGERATRVQRKIAAVEKRVCAYDPKTVTVPESDLLTFAQRKQHYETDKSFQKELFTSDTRPHSVKQLYTEAGKELLPITVSGSSAAHSTAITPPRSISLNGDLLLNDHDVLLNGSAANGAADEEHLLCISDFGNANRRLRTRIDAEIEIRLPAAIEDLRKWTSSEALGDVTVTPDCMHHVDTSISTSMVIGDNGVLTPALSPSVLSADAVDALYGQNLSQPVDSGHHQPNHQPLLPNDINKDVPLNHRLPSPEEQTKLIALKYPAEVISVNTSGKHFQRMCAARKSTTGCYAGGQNGTNAPSSSSSASPENNQTDANNLDDNLQTVSRRSRSRKVRGKRRNTIAGIDQKEIQDAANGHRESKNASSSATSPAPATSASVSATDGSKKSKKFGRSKSSDILKKESVALPYDKGKSTLTRLNSLKQWGRNRFKFMQRNGEMNGFGESSQLDTSGCSSQNSSAEKPESSINTGGGSGMIAPLQPGSKQSRNIDDECVVHDLITQKSESRFSHERKPSYSSSEKSMTVSSSGQLRGKLQLAAAHVKMRETATLNRQRRNGLHGLAGKDEQPHSSSGNWSASSESGRASIGSEITMTHPKSSASNTSLNVSSFQPCGSSGPPSSMLSRRRFLNTSASSSVTSEGTATPELQSDGCAGTYPNHLDDETSSAYSCDTEGYYTSFHMDSGLRTLKEEEPPMTPLQQSLHTSSYSFGSQSNQTVLNAENEYELYGRGSTSTTTSSAGTVCTTLLNAAAITGPDVPERTSSLGKHSSSRSQSNSASNSTLERSYSSSTIGSTLERTGTIKRNVKLTAQSEDSSSQLDHQQQHGERSAMPLPSVCAGELEYSESSDLEGVERIERIKQKTAITSKRIPSMCIITPTTSDDDEHHDRTLTNLSVEVEHDEQEVEEAEQLTPTNASSKDYNLNELKQTPTKALSGMFEKLKVKLVSGNKISPPKPASSSAVNDDELYDMAGEYVTIADISNNNNKNHPLHNRGKMHASSAASSSLGIYYSNDIVRQVKAEQSSGSGSASATANSTSIAEYVSLNELPQHLRRHAVVSNPNHPPKESGDCAQLPSGLGEKAAVATSPPSAHRSGSESCGVPMYAEISELREEKSLISSATSGGNGGTQQRRVRTNAEGKIIYDSDSLKRRKGAHTTFAPGPYVKETESALLSATREVTGESASSSPPSTGLSSTTASATKSAKLLLLNGGGAVPGTRKVANVRPIVSKSPLSKSPNTSGMSVYSGNYQEQKQMLANHTNPFYETIATPSNMMPSPSGKSNSSTGSTATNSSSSGNSGEEGYQRFSNIYEQVQVGPTSDIQANTDDIATSAFQRNAPIYWTLQSRRSQPKPQASGNVICRDDLYATPIRRADRLARATAANGSAGPSDGKSNISPIVPRNRDGVFLTSTPTRGETDRDVTAPMKQPSRNWTDNSPERLNTCADRIGQSKTTLLDFKKLLLAKSAKTSPVQRKVSAVEMLKKTSAPMAIPATSTTSSTGGVTASKPTLNSSMKLLDLSGSPKTFANRRMLRQGQFGSPSKTFVPKMRAPGSVVAAVAAAPRTDIMSTTIPEANSEEDHSTSGGSRASSEISEAAARQSSFDLKRNFFLQTEENNFMRGELKANFARGNNHSSSNGGAANTESNKVVNAAPTPPVASSAAQALPSFETAL